MTVRKGSWFVASFLVSAFILILESCGGSSSSNDTPAAGSCSSQAAVETASYDELWTKVFSGQCGSCHGGGEDTKTVGGPDLQTQDSFYTGLFGKKAGDYPEWVVYNAKSGCADYNFIKGGDASASVLTAVLDSGTALSGCATLLHTGSPVNACITTGNLAKLKDWINAGATR